MPEDLLGPRVVTIQFKMLLRPRLVYIYGFIFDPHIGSILTIHINIVADGKSSQVRDPLLLLGDGLGTAAVDFPLLLHDVLLQVLDVLSQARVLDAPIPACSSSTLFGHIA